MEAMLRMKKSASPDFYAPVACRAQLRRYSTVFPVARRSPRRLHMFTASARVLTI